MCLVLLPEMEGEGKCTHVRCAQVDQRLCLVDKLQEEMGRMRSICESDKVVDQWNHAMLSQVCTYQPGTATAKAGLASDLHQDKGSNLRDTED